ncbi:hypothetical protein F66182_11357, partial [Fusarium sp. NRRL 66182]
MAELAALGAAAGILQVIDFGTRFIVTTYQMARSNYTAASSSNDLQDLQNASANLRHLQYELQTIALHDHSHNALVLLAEKSAVILKEMLDSIQGLERNDQGRKRDALRKAWLTLWKADRLENLQTKLRDVKADLTFYLAINLRTTARATLESQEQLLVEMRSMRTDLNDLGEIASNADDLGSGYGSLALEYLTNGLERHQEIKSELTSALITNIHTSEGHSDLNDPTHIQVSEKRRARLEQIFIQRLLYHSMQERESTIKDAHKGTFRWIFEGNSASPTPSPGFRDWLESKDKLYWITGKAGSGKSTLMRYIVQPASQAAKPRGRAIVRTETTADSPGRCREYLHRWSGDDQRLTIASFHFWAIGSKLQASQGGLFRTLLFQLLHAHPEAIAVVGPSRWESLCLFNEDPKSISEDELGDMFRRAVVHISTYARVALFIDGLDEFDGDCGDLIAIVKECTCLPIKVCVSSRPWTEFEDAFEACPRLRMEDLTHEDITKYVVTRFESDHQFQRLQRRQTEVASNLIQAIVTKASGVFLWVTVVVASLLAGMGAGDRIEDLEMRLALLPAEIKQLYERILESVDPIYLEHAAQLFKLMSSCKEPPSLMLLWFADEVKFMDRAVSERPSTISYEEMSERLDDMRRRLNSRCRGLLEIHENTTDSSDPDFGGSVRYLHTTVYEFIWSQSTQQTLKKYLTTPYDPDIRISAAYGALAKIRMQSMTKGEIQHVSGDLSPGDHFLCLATERSVLEYVKAKVKRGGLVTAKWAAVKSYQQGIFSSTLWNLKRRQEAPAISLLSL